MKSQPRSLSISGCNFSPFRCYNIDDKNNEKFQHLALFTNYNHCVHSWAFRYNKAGIIQAKVGLGACIWRLCRTRRATLGCSQVDVFENSWGGVMATEI